MARAIVIGGAGFIGSHLVDALVRRHDDVVVVDNLSTGRLANLAHAISGGRVTFVYADAAVDVDTLRATLARVGRFGKVDTIYHLAAHGAVGSVGTMSLIEIALERAATFVYVTAATDGQLGELEVGGISADSDTAYARTRFADAVRFDEAAVAAAVGSRGLDARIVRIGDCYGPRMAVGASGAIYELFDAALAQRPARIEGTGVQLSSMTYIDDAIASLALVAGGPSATAVPIAIGSGDDRSILDVAKVLARVTNIRLDPQSVVETTAGVTPRRWQPVRGQTDDRLALTPLEAGLRATYDWYMRESSIFV